MNGEEIDDIINQKGIKVMKVAQSVEICLNSKCIHEKYSSHQHAFISL